MAKKGKKITVKESGAWRNGTDGNDTITVTAKEEASVFGNKGNDAITVKRGTHHKICGDDYGESYYYSTYSGKDTITLAGGSENKVWGGKGADKIYVKKGAGFSTICGCEGNDTITVYKGARAGKESDYANIDGGTGKDTITVNGGSQTTKKYYSIDGDDGNDKITVTGGRYYEINGGSGKDIIKVKNARDFVINQSNSSGKDTITITGGRNGSVCADDKSKVTINRGNGHRVCGWDKGGNIVINGGSNIEICDSSLADDSNDVITVNGGSGTIGMGEGIDTIKIDFKNAAKVRNWDISVSHLTNNRLTVLGASSTEFTFERKWTELGPSYISDDRWIMTNKSTGATITLDGWYSNWTETFSIYFKKDNKIVSSVPAKAEVDYLNLH